MKENEIIGFDVEVSVTLSKTMTLHTADYITDTDTNGDDIEEFHMVRAFHDWESDYESECYTIQEMLEELEKYIESELPMSTGKRRTRLKGMLKDCKGWEKEDFNAEEV